MAGMSETMGEVFGRPVTWLGRSGQAYELTGESLADFAMAGDALYLIAKGRNVLWVGSTNELVGDPSSRARFRLALGCADRIFRVGGQGDDAVRLSIIWDLEGGVPEYERSAA